MSPFTILNICDQHVGMPAFTQSTAENGVTLTHFIYIAKSHFILKGFTIGTIGILDLEILIRISKNPPQEKASYV